MSKYTEKVSDLLKDYEDTGYYGLNTDSETEILAIVSDLEQQLASRTDKLNESVYINHQLGKQIRDLSQQVEGLERACNENDELISNLQQQLTLARKVLEFHEHCENGYCWSCNHVIFGHEPDCEWLAAMGRKS